MHVSISYSLHQSGGKGGAKSRVRNNCSKDTKKSTYRSYSHTYKLLLRTKGLDNLSTNHPLILYLNIFAFFSLHLLKSFSKGSTKTYALH